MQKAQTPQSAHPQTAPHAARRDRHRQVSLGHRSRLPQHENHPQQAQTPEHDQAPSTQPRAEPASNGPTRPELPDSNNVTGECTESRPQGAHAGCRHAVTNSRSQPSRRPPRPCQGPAGAPGQLASHSPVTTWLALNRAGARGTTASGFRSLEAARATPRCSCGPARQRRTPLGPCSWGLLHGLPKRSAELAWRTGQAGRLLPLQLVIHPAQQRGPNIQLQAQRGQAAGMHGEDAAGAGCCVRSRRADQSAPLRT
jgi:hypothetical protein